LFGLLERHYKILITSLALLLAAGYVNKLCWPHKGGLDFEYGYYPYEDWKEGTMRWTWRKTRMRIEAVSDLFGFKIAARGFNSTGPEGLTFKVFLDGEMLDKVHFFDGGRRYLYFYIPDIEGRKVEIRTEVDRTFNPLRMKISEDRRDLGVAVSPVSFLKIMPKDGVGFYGWQTMDAQSEKRMAQSGRQIEKHPSEMRPTETSSISRSREKRFRWTGKRASVSIADCGLRIAERAEGREQSGLRNADWGKRGPSEIRSTVTDVNFTGQGDERGLILFLWCGHPDIEKEGVGVKILGDGVLLREIEFGDRGVKRVEFGGEELAGKEVLTFEVSRTWNPKRMGVSKDIRDLGVAVAIP